MLTLSPEARDMILGFEGLGQPARWPGLASGITIGFGYDLGFKTAAQFAQDWGPHLSPAVMARLGTALGRRAVEAKQIAPQFSDIKIDRNAAGAVFMARTVPGIAAATAKAMPGAERLPVDAQGALMSLVMNRGASMTDKDPIEKRQRLEMREIRDAVARYAAAPGDDHLVFIAAQLRAMKRLWPVGFGGLLKRREAEARLVESTLGGAARDRGAGAGSRSLAPAAAPAITAADFPNAPWMAFAIDELAHGVKTAPGSEKNPRVLEYFQATTYSASDDEVAWCSAFANWCMLQANVAHGRSAAARSWRKWGEPLAAPIPGCVVVLWRESLASWKGHVGFYVGESGDYLKLLGGNQGNPGAVSIALYPKTQARFQRGELGYRWASGAPRG